MSEVLAELRKKGSSGGADFTTYEYVTALSYQMGVDYNLSFGRLRKNSNSNDIYFTVTGDCMIVYDGRIDGIYNPTCTVSFSGQYNIKETISNITTIKKFIVELKAGAEIHTTMSGANYTEFFVGVMGYAI